MGKTVKSANETEVTPNDDELVIVTKTYKVLPFSKPDWDWEVKNGERTCFEDGIEAIMVGGFYEEMKCRVRDIDKALGIMIRHKLEREKWELAIRKSQYETLRHDVKRHEAELEALGKPSKKKLTLKNPKAGYKWFTWYSIRFTEKSFEKEGMSIDQFRVLLKTDEKNTLKTCVIKDKFRDESEFHGECIGERLDECKKKLMQVFARELEKESQKKAKRAEKYKAMI